jgi:hypothetical protein
MSQVFDLLEKISQQPGLYLGTASITALRHFLVGYKFARQEIGLPQTETELDFYQEFQPWLQQRLHLQTANSWDSILLFQFVDEKTAFAHFFALLKEFRCRDRNQDIDPILLDEVSETAEEAA